MAMYLLGIGKWVAPWAGAPTNFEHCTVKVYPHKFGALSLSSSCTPVLSYVSLLRNPLDMQRLLEQETCQNCGISVKETH